MSTRMTGKTIRLTCRAGVGKDVVTNDISLHKVGKMIV
jgi:hypothetical protein